MIALELQETKEFMNKLLLSSAFDHFCLVHAVIATFQTVDIDGKVNTDYYDDEASRPSAPYNSWEQVKPFCLQLIKGRRVPLSFRITLTLSPENIENVLNSLKLDLAPEQVKGLLLNFSFQGGKVTCTTGTSLSVFTMDKRLEQEWDRLAEIFFKKNGIISTHYK